MLLELMLVKIERHKTKGGLDGMGGGGRGMERMTLRFVEPSAYHHLCACIIFHKEVTLYII